MNTFTAYIYFGEEKRGAKERVNGASSKPD
jgi:hypothetical protein